jgi:hypothetical protein
VSPSVALEVVAAEHVLDAIDIPVDPVAPRPPRGWSRWFFYAALAV